MDTPGTSRRSKGGVARAKALTPAQRSEIAKKGADARWAAPVPEPDEDAVIADPTMPVASYRGALTVLGQEIPCYVLSNGVRVIGRTSATEFLTGIKGGGSLEKYIAVSALEPFINKDLILERLVPFRLLEVEGLNKAVKGLPHDLFIEICQGFVKAMEANLNPAYAGSKLTTRQQQMAIQASMFLSACAKVGLEALIDEATGAQYDRVSNALQIKLAAYLEQEMRKWEKTFPDELWSEFARLTTWKGALHQRPKYWGKLVMELIYENLDKDVAQWLKENAPAPKHGQNYHQWLSGQYGLKKLVEHIWMVIGMAKTCDNMTDLRDRVGALYGKRAFQFRLYLPEDDASSAPPPPS